MQNISVAFRPHFELGPRYLDRVGDRAAALDRWADIELAHGHHSAAERLAWQADGLRKTAR